MINVLGFPIHDDLNLKLESQNQIIINTINPHSYCIALNDSIFRKSLFDSDILLPDGIGFVYASKLLNKKNINKVSGFDLHQYLIKIANKNQSKVFYLGSSTSTLKKIQNNINKSYPNIRLATFSPPFKSKFSALENIKMIEILNSFQPDYLFIGMTAPKQEKWVYENKHKLNAKVISSIGAVFDFYSGNIKRSHPFWIKYGLEWFPRFLKEPRRLFKRNLVSTPKFILQVLYLKVFNKEFFKNN
ncbi:WecB/TagA/CpsF family glycosyltransferase [Flavobacteriaceae bacterium]|nr:WecB/TagA/CpsF family glycosyltransferase [Flavobacteriaceae bacterium]